MIYEKEFVRGQCTRLQADICRIFRESSRKIYIIDIDPFIMYTYNQERTPRCLSFRHHLRRSHLTIVDGPSDVPYRAILWVLTI